LDGTKIILRPAGTRTISQSRVNAWQLIVTRPFYVRQVDEVHLKDISPRLFQMEECLFVVGFGTLCHTDYIGVNQNPQITCASILFNETISFE
jgi:hypothetical protein